jgi:hypothetical protein
MIWELQLFTKAGANLEHWKEVMMSQTQLKD